MLKRLLHVLPSLLSVLLLVLSVWVIHRQLQAYGSRDLWRQLAAIPSYRVVWAIALTGLNGLVFTGYDTLAVRYVRHVLPYGQTALAALTSIPISNSVGVALLSGSAIRYRLYAAWGMPSGKIAQIIAFCNFSFWLGLLSVGGLLFLWQPVTIPAQLHLPFHTAQPIGVAFLSAMVMYLGWNLWQPAPSTVVRTPIPRLPWNLCGGQILTSSLDWTLAAAVLYVLLPQPTSISYATYFGIYLLAQFAGVVSNVPGGLGVFETVMLLLLTPAIPHPVLFSALIAYRAIYYLLPLAIAILLLGLYELRSSRSSSRQ